MSIFSKLQCGGDASSVGGVDEQLCVSTEECRVSELLWVYIQLRATFPSNVPVPVV